MHWLEQASIFGYSLYEENDNIERFCRHTICVVNRKRRTCLSSELQILQVLW